MKTQMIATLILLFISAEAISQHTVSGKVNNSSDSTALKGVNIIIKGSNTGTTTNAQGDFTLQIRQFPVTIIFSYIGFETIEMKIASSSSIKERIFMQPSISHLKTFNVYQEKIICLHPRDQYFVTDYKIMNGSILALAYKNRMHGKQYLILFGSDGSRISETEISNNRGLYEDPDMNCYIKILDEGMQVYHDTSGFMFSEPFEGRYIDTAQKRLTAMKGDTIILRHYFYSNQGLSYYTFASESGESKEFRTYFNEEGAGMMSWGGFFDGNEFDKRFAEQIFFKPIKAPLFISGEKIIVFNMLEGQIEHIDQIAGETIQTVPTDLKNNKNWDGEIYYDKGYNKFYAGFKLRGISTIREIDINSGELGTEHILDGYAHIENIRIYEGMLFFLYKKHYGDDYKRLYMSSLH
jgi:hypothetical protein